MRARVAQSACQGIPGPPPAAVAALGWREGFRRAAFRSRKQIA